VVNDEELRALVAGDATFMEVLDHLRRRGPRPLTPIEFLRIFQEELGISFVKARAMLDCFDPGMRPIVDTDLINERGRLLLERRG
jgi:hypothetical protein